MCTVMTSIGYTRTTLTELMDLLACMLFGDRHEGEEPMVGDDSGSK